MVTYLLLFCLVFLQPIFLPDPIFLLQSFQIQIFSQIFDFSIIIAYSKKLPRAILVIAFFILCCLFLPREIFPSGFL